MYTKRTNNVKAKKRGVLALSLLLIAAMVLPQAVLATDTHIVIGSAETVSERSERGNSEVTKQLSQSTTETVETSTQNPLENSGGGGQPIR